MDAKTTGRFIAELRKQKGYTQKELAEKIMVTDKAISRWETGKGLPDTSLLKPLGDILGVSVGELLSGKIIEEAEMKDQTDRIILDSLKYSSRMLANMVNLVLLLIGLALVISPVFLTSRKYYWVGGIVFIGIAVLRTYLKKEGKTVKLTDRAFYAVGIAFHAISLILELLPLGAVLIFAPSPTERVIHTYSYFDLNLVGYANFSPMLTGILTVAVVILGITILCRYEKAKKRKRFCNLFLVDKCLSVGYNMLKFFGRYMTMTARFSTTYSSTRCTMAAACSSARISPILDTAMILAVSICVVRLLLAAAA